MKNIEHEIYATLHNSSIIQEQINLKTGFVNITRVGLRSIFRNKIGQPNYSSYKDYKTDVSYWKVMQDRIINHKPVIFSANDSLSIQFINQIWLFNEFNTIEIRCTLAKPTYMNHDEKVVFNTGAIHVLIR